MIDRINEEVIGFLAKAGLPTAQPNVQEAQAPRAPQQHLQTSRTDVPQHRSQSSTANAPRATAASSAPGRGAMPPPQQRQPMEPVRVEKKIGRNDPCPCGSGKKYKQCHGKEA